MSVGLLERPATGSVPAPSTGGVPARRAMVRWAWRLFRREWRQQLLILLLIVVAVAAVVVGAAVAVNTPPPANAGYGTAHDLATFNLSAPTSKAPSVTLSHVQAQIATLEQRFGRVQVIENETFGVPGSDQTYQLRSQDPHGPYGGPMLQLLSGSYPTGSDQIAVTPGLASELNVSVGDTWPQGGKTVVGIVQNPQSLLDEFALVPPGQVTHPSQVSVLFDASPSAAKDLPSYVTTPGGDQQQRHQPVDDRAGAGDSRDAPDRPGVDRWLHRSGPAAHAFPRDARIDGGDRPQRPARPGGQRRHCGCGGRCLGLRARSGPLVGLPTTQRAERAPRHRHVRTALERDRAGHGARGHRDVLRRQLPGAGHYPRAGRQRAGRASSAPPADPPLAGARRDRPGHRVRPVLGLGRRRATAAA